MRRFVLSVVVACISVVFLGQASAADRAKPSVLTMPPVVVSTLPAAGDTEVDPATTELRVTFSKRMQNGSWSWSNMSKETTPEITGKPKYLEDGKTCVLPVKLEPGKTYIFWLNSEKFHNFKDAKGQPAIPYLLVFETNKQ